MCSKHWRLEPSPFIWGRSYVYGLAVFGQRGVQDVIGNVLTELDPPMDLPDTPTRTRWVRMHWCVWKDVRRNANA